jgi:hypothetical protein
MVDTVSVVTETPAAASLATVSPTLADAITAAIVQAANAAGAASQAAASATAAQTAATNAQNANAAVVTMTNTVTADLAQVSADMSVVINDVAQMQAMSQTLLGDLGQAQNLVASAAAASTAATNAANTAASSASTATTQASAAAASAANANTAVTDRIYGVLAGPSDPSFRPDTTATAVGDMYYNSGLTALRMKVNPTTWASVAVTLTAIPSGAIVPQNVDFSTSITVAASDNSVFKNSTSATPVTVTLPNNMTQNWNTMVHQAGAGQVTFVAGSGATLNNRLGQYRCAGQFSVCAVFCVSNVGGTSAVYTLAGDTSP